MKPLPLLATAGLVSPFTARAADGRGPTGAPSPSSTVSTMRPLSNQAIRVWPLPAATVGPYCWPSPPASRLTGMSKPRPGTRRTRYTSG